MKTIIIADDDQIFLRTMSRHLQNLGFNVVANHNGDNVLRQIAELKPVACIIDMVMPGKEGMETIFEISQTNDRPFVIGISSTQAYLNIVNHLVVDAVLLKPITPEALKGALEKIGVTL